MNKIRSCHDSRKLYVHARCTPQSIPSTPKCTTISHFGEVMCSDTTKCGLSLICVCFKWLQGGRDCLPPFAPISWTYVYKEEGRKKNSLYLSTNLSFLSAGAALKRVSLTAVSYALPDHQDYLQIRFLWRLFMQHLAFTLLPLVGPMVNLILYFSPRTRR